MSSIIPLVSGRPSNIIPTVMWEILCSNLINCEFDIKLLHHAHYVTFIMAYALCYAFQNRPKI